VGAASGGGIGGFLARGVLSRDRKVGFDLDILDRDVRVPLCRALDVPLGPAKVDLDYEGGPRVGHFLFLEEGLEQGASALDRVLISPPRLAVIDEIGFLELAGGGWHPWLDRLFPEPGCPVLAIVRDELESAVRERYELGRAPRWTVGDPMDLEALLEPRG